MKRTKVILLAGLIGMVAAPGMLYAHCGHCDMSKDKAGGKEAMADQDHMAMMAKELGLTSDQQTKIKAIKEDMTQKMEALHQETHSKVNAVLTKEQQAKHEKMPSACGMCQHSKGEKTEAPHKH